MLRALRTAEDRLAAGEVPLVKATAVDTTGTGAVGPSTAGAAGDCAGSTANAAAAAADAATMLARVAMAGSRLRTGDVPSSAPRNRADLSGAPLSQTATPCPSLRMNNGAAGPRTHYERISRLRTAQITERPTC